MKGKLARRIAIVNPDWASLAREATAGKTGFFALIRPQMRPTGADVKTAQRYRVRPTARQARLFGAVVARVHGRDRGSFVVDRQLESKPAAIAVPEAVDGMDQDPERRWLQAFSTHRPLLERLPGGIGGEVSGRAQSLG